MQQKIVELVHKRDIQNSVIYSSFYAKSLEKLKILDGGVEFGVLDTKVSNCLYKLNVNCGATALHPFWEEMELLKAELQGYGVRAWFSGHLYSEKPTGT